jgi:hypothetical protein
MFFAVSNLRVVAHGEMMWRELLDCKDDDEGRAKRDREVGAVWMYEGREVVVVVVGRREQRNSGRGGDSASFP